MPIQFREDVYATGRSRGKPELWICRHCHRNREAMPTGNGRAKVVRFRTGFVGVQLTCGHWAAVKLDRVQ